MNNTTVFSEEFTTIFRNDSNNDTQSYDKNSTENMILELWRSKKWFAQDKIKLINSHWFKYPPPSDRAHEFLAVLYILLFIVGIFGNSLVIFMFVRCKSLRTPANILVANLALSDFGMMIKMPLFIHNSLKQGLPLGDISCKIYGYLGGLTGTVSICTLSCIALDRYYVVVYPLNRSITKIRSKIFIAITWIYGFTFTSLPLLYPDFGTFTPEGYLTSCSFDYLTNVDTVRYFILGYFCAAYVIPFSIICFCYSKIIRVVILAKNIGSKMEDPSISGRHCKEQDQKKKEIRLALVVLGIIGLWFISWTPYAIVALLGISGQKHLITPLVTMIPALFCKAASCIDPFIYAVTNQKFKEELKLFLCKQNSQDDSKKKKVWSTKISLQQTMQCSIDTDDGAEEITFPMESIQSSAEERTDKKMKEDVKYTPKKIRRSSVIPSEGVTLRSNLSDLGKKNRTSWVFRPSFSNRNSSIRNMARTWNRSRQSSTEETGPV